MKRRNFIKKLSALCAVAPLVGTVAAQSEEVKEDLPKTNLDSLGEIFKVIDGKFGQLGDPLFIDSKGTLTNIAPSCSGEVVQMVGMQIREDKAMLYSTSIFPTWTVG